MAKCGKGCMPECEYFTTGGCISPFNCPYKIETGYINSATSTTDSLTGLLMEFDEIGLLRQRRAPDLEQYAVEGREKVRKEIERLKSENADLRERLDKAEHRAEVAEKDFERHKRALRNAVWGLITEGVYGGVAETEQGLQSEIQNELERTEREIEEEKGE